MAKRWYSVSVLSNFEKKIAEQIRHAVSDAGLEDEIEEVLVPTEEVIEVRRGKKVTAERRFHARLCAGAHGDVRSGLSPDQLDQPRDRISGSAGPPDADARCRGERDPEPGQEGEEARAR